MIIRKILISIIMLTFALVIDLSGNDKKTLVSNELHLGYLSVDKTFGKLEMDTVNLYTKVKHKLNDKSIMSMRTEIIYVDYIYDGVSPYSQSERDAMVLVIVDEMYYKTAITDRVYFVIGKIDFRTDNGTIVTLPQDRKNNINPLMSNYVADGAYLTYHDGNFITSVGILGKDVFFDTILTNEDKVDNAVYGSVHGLSLFTNYKDDLNTATLSYFAISGELYNGTPITSNIYGANYTYDDSLRSGYTYYIYTAASDTLEANKRLYGYSVMGGVNKYFNVPFINRDATIGIESMILKGDYVSMNTGRFISTYSMQKNGVQYSTYLDMSVTNKTHLKFRFSRFKPDGDVMSTKYGLERIHTDHTEPQNDIRFEIQYNF